MWTKGAKNAKAIGDSFVDGDVLVTTVTFANTASSTATITHGLGATVDFVLFSTDDNTPTIFLGTINSTSIVFTRTATTTSGTAKIYVLAGNLA